MPFACAHSFFLCFAMTFRPMQRLAIRLLGGRARHGVATLRSLSNNSIMYCQSFRTVMAMSSPVCIALPAALAHSSMPDWYHFEQHDTTPKVIKSPSLNEAFETFVEGAKDVYHDAKYAVADSANSDGGRAILYITAANVAVYLLWKVIPTPFMIRFVVAQFQIDLGNVSRSPQVPVD